MKTKALSLGDYSKLDKLGIALSLICAVHCTVLPFVIMTLPLMGRYYIMHPYFHGLLALMILPVGGRAFVSGYRHHRNKRVFFLGVPGLLLVGLVPVFVHNLGYRWNEAPLMLLGSFLLVSAHWMNRRSCGCRLHH